MIVYLDTSALVPLLVEEPASDACAELWDAADSIATTRLAYIETAAALAMAVRMGRIDLDAAGQAREVLAQLWPVVDVIEIEERVMVSAADLAARYGLRGYDATHCAAAIAIEDSELVAASGDRHLLAAWRTEGLAVRDTTR